MRSTELAGTAGMPKSDAFAQALKAKVVPVVAAIPEGRVTTYGTIARHLHVSARQVARVLATLTPEESAALPWFRVVAAQGFVVRTYSIAVASHIAHISRGAVPVAISLNMSAFSIGMAVAAGVGGVVLDSFGAMALPLIGIPMVALALFIWRRVPESVPEITRR